jgi:hypothetical protein
LYGNLPKNKPLDLKRGALRIGDQLPHRRFAVFHDGVRNIFRCTRADLFDDGIDVLLRARHQRGGLRIGF